MKAKYILLTVLIVAGTLTGCKKESTPDYMAALSGYTWAWVDNGDHGHTPHPGERYKALTIKGDSIFFQTNIKHPSDPRVRAGTYTIDSIWHWGSIWHYLTLRCSFSHEGETWECKCVTYNGNGEVIPEDSHFMVKNNDGLGVCGLGFLPADSNQLSTM